MQNKGLLISKDRTFFEVFPGFSYFVLNPLFFNMDERVRTDDWFLRNSCRGAIIFVF